MNAIKDRKLDAVFWVGGVPTPSITDLAATPGMKVKLIDHGDGAEAMRGKYGPIYVKNKILANAYPGDVVYQITKTLFEKKEELVRVHKDASFLDLNNQSSGASPIPFHLGAVRYLKERGIAVK